MQWHRAEAHPFLNLRRFGHWLAVAQVVADQGVQRELQVAGGLVFFTFLLINFDCRFLTGGAKDDYQHLLSPPKREPAVIMFV